MVKKKILVPGLVDLHVHFRDPGFFYKEDIGSGIAAALKGGVTSAMVMPNTLPPIDSPKIVTYQLKRAKEFGFDLLVAGCATRKMQGELVTDVSALKRAGVKALTDDGLPIQKEALMKEILRQCRLHNLVCMQHAEDRCISLGRPVSESKTQRKIGVEGQPKSAEFEMVERDIRLANEVGAHYHVLHLSCAKSLELVRLAKMRKQKVTCEVSPHHLLLDDRSLSHRDTLKKMNPPLRSDEDRRQLLKGLQDGVIDAVASDHAPHSEKEKRSSLNDAPFGVVGVESSILVLMTLVRAGKLSLKRAIHAMTTGPAKVIGEESRIGTFCGEGALPNAVLIDPNYSRRFSRSDLFGRSKNSAFLGMELFGRVEITFLRGKRVR